MPPHAFRGPQVCKLVGITYRQLDYWARTGLARPSISDPVGSGYARLYSIEDVRMLVVLKAMLDAGISLQTARKALPFAREPEGLRWLLVGGPEPVMAAEGELERLCREIGVCTVVDLQREVVATSS